jgi:hypothetical protein
MLSDLPRSGARSATALAAITALCIVSIGCEDEVLGPASGFTPSECLSNQNCEGSGKIDSGVRSFADAGPPPVTGEVDTGTPPAEADAGIWPPPDSGVFDTGTFDSGTFDAGVVDSGPPPPDFLNLAGTHDTEYLFDWSAYLFGIGTIAGPLDTIAQIVAGNVNTGFPPLDSLIAQAVARFVPPWVRTVVNVLNSVANFFEEVEVTGVMNIAQALSTAQTTTLTAGETWSTLTVHIISQCPRGRQDPNYPQCAQQRINIVPRGRTTVGPLDVEVEVHDFRGTLQAGRPEADFMLDDRSVDVDLYKLVRIVIDLAINLGTNGQFTSLSAALNQIIDCAGLEAEAYRLAQNLGLGSLSQIAATAVRTACDREKQRVIDGIVNGLNGIGLSLVTFDYDQLGHAVDTNGNARPEKLQRFTVPDTIDGRFRLIVTDPLGGIWEGTNRFP